MSYWSVNLTGSEAVSKFLFGFFIEGLVINWVFSTVIFVSDESAGDKFKVNHLALFFPVHGKACLCLLF